jgi:hypothetical protein
MIPEQGPSAHPLSMLSALCRQLESSAGAIATAGATTTAAAAATVRVDDTAVLGFFTAPSDAWPASPSLLPPSPPPPPLPSAAVAVAAGGGGDGASSGRGRLEPRLGECAAADVGRDVSAAAPLVLFVGASAAASALPASAVEGGRFMLPFVAEIGATSN